jgi:hypothetical protein
VWPQGWNGSSCWWIDGGVGGCLGGWVPGIHCMALQLTGSAQAREPAYSSSMAQRMAVPREAAAEV